MRTSAAAVASALAIAAPGLRAETTSADAGPETRWYGWQIMLADAASTTLLVIGVDRGNTAVATLGGVGLFLAGPAIHLAHDAKGDAAKSFLFRTVPLAIGLGLFAAIPNKDCGEGCSELILPLAGFALSGAGVVADWIFLSREPVPARLSLGPARSLDGRPASGLALSLRF